MSDLHISLVAEGPTDKIAIEAFLSAIITKPFVVTLLQPEVLNAFNGNFGAKGSGWCGVARWCRAKAAEGFGNFETDPTMQHFDLVIIHLDGDVADKSYADCGENFPGEGLPLDLGPTMVAQRVAMLEKTLCEWLGVSAPGSKTVWCIPHLAMEAWIVAALFPSEVAALFPSENESGDSLESTPNLDKWLAVRPLTLRLRKNTRDYKAWATEFTQGWPFAITTCSQASRFDSDVRSHL